MGQYHRHTYVTGFMFINANFFLAKHKSEKKSILIYTFVKKIINMHIHLSMAELSATADKEINCLNFYTKHEPC